MQKVDYEKLTTQLQANEQADFSFQKRRHPEWTENYQLYRDKVTVNRLTQRQSINVPLIKGVVKTTQANTDEFPDIEFEDLGNDKDKEIVTNELWKKDVIDDRKEVKDVIDKKQDFLYGITHTKFNLVPGQNGLRIVTEIKDPFDILRDRYADPSNYDATADHITELGIYRTLDQLAENPMYDQMAVKRLKMAYATSQGLIKAEENTRQMVAKNERLSLMGVDDISSPQLGTTIVELKLYMQKVYDLADRKSHWHVIVMADTEILAAKPLQELLRVKDDDFIPYVTWSDDPERNDHYPDGIADIARTPNKLLNAMISAMAENRILRNFGMHYYNSSIEGFVPQSFQPQPFGWYGIPVPPGGKLDDVFKAVEIPDMSESLDELEYVKKLTETAVAANSTLQGETQQQNKVTLGEVELALSAAKERVSSIAKFYLLAQKEKGEKWAKLLNANADRLESVTLYKKSHKGNMYSKDISAKDFKSDEGYTCRVVSSAERQKQNVEEISKLNAAAQKFQGNPAFDKIYSKKLLDFIGATPEEAQAVMDFEDQKLQAPQMTPGMPPDAQNAPPQPVNPLPVPNLTPTPNAVPA